MPINPTYPGVYVQELDSGVHTITGVATSITAFVGHCLKGPVNEPITITSYAEFERMFGGLWLGSYLGYAVRDFYLNGGSQAIIVRVAAATAISSAVDLAVPGGSLTLVSMPQPEGSGPDKINVIVSKIQQGDSTASPAKLGTFTLTLTKSDDSSVLENYPSLTIEPSDSNFVTTVLAKSKLIRVQGNVPTSLPLDNSKSPAVMTLSNVTAEVSLGVTGGQGLNLAAINPGSWGDSLGITIDTYSDDNVSKAIAANYNLQFVDFFKLIITDIPSNRILESFDYLTIKDTDRRIDKVLANESTYVNVKGELPTNIPSVQGSLQLFGGSDGVTNADADRTAILGDQDDKTGIYALEKADIFNLLYIPPYKVTDGLVNRVGFSGVDVDSTLLVDAASYCKQRKAFLIFDAPSTWNTVSNAHPADFSALGDSSDHAAVFFPRIKQPNPLRNNQIEEFLPGGMIAGTMARIDAQRGVWKAPAGLEARLSGVNQLSVPLTDGDNGKLNPIGVNCLRTMPAAGAVIWGARTLQGDDRLGSQWKYIPVRRLALYLEQSLYQGTQWVVFEPNDEPLWRQIRLNVGSFMDTLFRQGAFQGQSAKEAYFVACDHTTTTQDDIDRGIVNIKVGFAPLKPAEFVIIQIQQIAGQN